MYIIYFQIISPKSIIRFHQHIWNFKSLFHFLIGGAEIFSLQNHIKPMINAVNEKRNKIIQLDRFLYELTSKKMQESFSIDEKQKVMLMHNLHLSINNI